MIHTLSVLVENKPGALMRITSLFARRLSRAARADGEDSRRELTAGGACVT